MKSSLVLILDFKVWFPFPFHRNFLSKKEKHEHNVIYCSKVKPCSKGASCQENHV